MRQMVEKILNSYGAMLTLRHDGKNIIVKGFLQPGKSVSQRSATNEVSPLGETHADTYQYIGPVEHIIQPGDMLTKSGVRYEFRQVEKVLYQNTPIYLWGLCVRKGGDGTWA